MPIEDIEEVVSALEESKNSGFVQSSFLMDQSLRETNLQKIEEEFQESVIKLQRLPTEISNKTSGSFVTIDKSAKSSVDDKFKVSSFKSKKKQNRINDK